MQAGSATSTDVDPNDVKHVVILVHGIRDRGDWQQTVETVIGSPQVKVVMPKYGWFPGRRFIVLRDAAVKPMKRVFAEYENAKAAYPNARISLIAHSFGTHVVTKLLDEHPHVRLWRIIFCGSVVKQDFQWQKYFQCFGDETNKNGFIINDCGNQDSWPVVGSFSRWCYGDAGTYGFGNLYVQDRFHKGGHSLFFDPGFIDKYWKPFILDGRVEPGTAQQGDQIPQYVRVLYKLPFNLQTGLLVAIVLTVIGFFGVRWWRASPPMADISMPVFIQQFHDVSKDALALSAFADRYADHSVTWDCIVIQPAKAECAYWIGSTKNADRSNQLLAILSDKDEFDPFLKTTSVRIKGTVRVNNLGPYLDECRLVPKGP